MNAKIGNLLPETATDHQGRTWYQTSEGTDEYCDYWQWCGFRDCPKHRTLAEVVASEPAEVSR